MGYFSDLDAEGPFRTCGEADAARRAYPEEYHLDTMIAAARQRQAERDRERERQAEEAERERQAEALAIFEARLADVDDGLATALGLTLAPKDAGATSTFTYRDVVYQLSYQTTIDGRQWRVDRCDADGPVVGRTLDYATRCERDEYTDALLLAIDELANADVDLPC